ncbi:MAG: hypothetical protein KUG53_02055 [Pseudomonadales bacterium]|nr:hypothetical protein [Pseudomonadales bacterium]
MFFSSGKTMVGGAAVMLATLLTGCSSTSTMVSALPPEHYEILGPTEGSAAGSLGMVSTAYYVIPMGLNSRTERAYSRAIEKVPGATGLIDVTYDESWLWWVIGTARTVTIQGTAIKEVK